MRSISPTVEGFRAAFRRPLFTLAEITWRWTAGATAAALLMFGVFEYLDTLPVTNGELLFLRTRQPYLVSEVIARILRGSLNRVVISALVAGLLLALIWIVTAAVGRIATVRGLLDYFRREIAGGVSRADVREVSVSANSPLSALLRLNFLRAALALAAGLGLAGASILAGFASPAAKPQPGVAFFLFLSLAALVCLVWWVLNWFLSLAGMFAVRDGEDALGAIISAVAFCRERTGRIFAVSIWTGLTHLVALVVATTAASMPLGFAAILPWRLVAAAIVLVSLIYFAIADWIYMARLAGYVCIAEMPESVLAPSQPEPVIPPPVQTTIDRDEPILSDLPNLAVET
jgi:hypothetical protein